MWCMYRGFKRFPEYINNAYHILVLVLSMFEANEYSHRVLLILYCIRRTNAVVIRGSQHKQRRSTRWVMMLPVSWRTIMHTTSNANDLISKGATNCTMLAEAAGKQLVKTAQ